MFELLTPTEGKMTSFTGRVQRHGDQEVPAVSFKVKFEKVPNTWLDRISPTLRHALFKAAEGQEQLPGMEDVTPFRRSKDINRINLDNVYEGWRITVEHGIDDESALVMGSVKVDDFVVDLYDTGHVDLEVRFGTADVDRHGAGLLWAKQKEKVHLLAQAPKPKEDAIDGSTEAFKKDYSQDESPDRALQADLLAAGADADKPAGEGDAGGNWPFGTSVGSADGGGPPDSDTDSGGAAPADGGSDGEGSDTDMTAFEAGAKAAVKRGRRKTAAVME